MGSTAFSENYSICLNEDGSPREIDRSGDVVTYKAIGFQSGRTVAMQLIPLTSVDQAGRAQFEERARSVQKLDQINIARVFDFGVEDEHVVFVSEYLNGETAAAWLTAHGPMPADAVLRIGLQVVNALAAAAFHSLMHRSIQPANLMIVPGVAPDGGWPRIKLLNFGLVGLKLYSEENELRELAPPLAPEFASPEQLENGTVDFRSEIFSLGATMCFLLTSAAPLVGDAIDSGLPKRILPPTSAIPRLVRNILGRMLRNNPDERPQDPILFAQELRTCLQRVERRNAFTRSFTMPFAAGIAPKPERAKNRTVAPALAFAALLLILAALGAIFLPQRLHTLSQRNSEPVGVPIGVPETSAEPTDTPSLEVAKANPPPALPSTSTAPSSSPQIAVNNRVVEPPAPAEGPTGRPQQENLQPPITAAQQPVAESAPVNRALTESTTTAAQNSSTPAAASKEPLDSSAAVADKKRESASATKLKSHRPRVAKSSNARGLPPLRVGAMPARFVGTTPDGSWVLQLPSGENVVTPPVPDTANAPVISHRRVRRLHEVRRAIPVENEPPVIVLPAGN
ncbi:MAG TPA: protein kinase [Chthoniobacterales bacterium]|nr:protein kinase [Chthoniobacterales bacterium]